MEKLSREQRQSVFKELRAKLDAIHARRSTVAPAKSSDAIIYRRDLPRDTRPMANSDRLMSANPVKLEDHVDGVVVDTDFGVAYLIEKQVSDFDRHDLFVDLFSGSSDYSAPIRKRLEKITGLESLSPADFIFMDIETTGLGSSPLFLIGVMIWEDHRFVVRQFLARDYAEEAAVISMFTTECSGKRLLVTFNGKSFDYPYIRTRARANAVPFEIDLAHFDLLHEARRVWRGILPNCKLQTLERYICNRWRNDDIPGNMIPDVYHDFVRSGNAHLMIQILRHNRLDLITLADLMTRFPKSC